MQDYSSIALSINFAFWPLCSYAAYLSLFDVDPFSPTCPVPALGASRSLDIPYGRSLIRKEGCVISRDHQGWICSFSSRSAACLSNSAEKCTFQKLRCFATLRLTVCVLHGESRWLVAGPLCLLPLQSVWLRKRRYRTTLYCWFWLLHAVRDNCRIPGRQTVRLLLRAVFAYLSTIREILSWSTDPFCHLIRGRKRACVTYCITYILSCITKHSPHYKVLMLGRVLGGIATSLLFSAFESWLVAEHNKVRDGRLFPYFSFVWFLSDDWINCNAEKN